MKPLNVNLQSLAVPIGDGGEMAEPEVGDMVQIMVEGRLLSKDGGRGSVEPVTVNGDPIDEAGAEDMPELSEEEMMAAEEAELRGMLGDDY